MKTNTIESASPHKLKRMKVICWIIDIEDERMYPVVNTRMPERGAIELPHIRSPARDCHVVAAGPDDYIEV